MTRVVTVRQPETVVVTTPQPKPMVVTHYVGAPGRDGRDGVDGAPGRDGIDGVDGAPGRDGVDGRDGDPLRTTGWRRIEGIESSDTGTATVDIRRDGNTVLIRVTLTGNWPAGGASGPLMTYDGFNPDVYWHDNRYAGAVPIIVNIGNGVPTHRGWVGLLAHPTARRVWINTTTAHGRMGSAIIQYPTADPWPETLPGVPV